MSEETKSSGTKLFWGMFIFPLLIAAGMALILCTIVFLTAEDESPESLVAEIKGGTPSKRWQKAYELSNELNRPGRKPIREEGLRKELIYILLTEERYDAKTRSFVALALRHLDYPEVREALRKSLEDPDEEVRLHALWSLGQLGDKDASGKIILMLQDPVAELRKSAAYVLGSLGATDALESLLVLLSDKTPDVRWNAAMAMARLGDDSGWNEMMTMIDRETLEEQFMLNEQQIEPIMVNAMKAIRMTKRTDAQETLALIAKKDDNLRVRQAAMEALK